MDITQALALLEEHVLPMVGIAIGAWIVGQLILGNVLKGLRAPRSLVNIVSPTTTFLLLVLGAHYLYEGTLPF